MKKGVHDCISAILSYNNMFEQILTHTTQIFNIIFFTDTHTQIIKSILEIAYEYKIKKSKERTDSILL